MARADRRRVTRAKPAVAEGTRSRDVANYEDDLFFSKLRKHAKWMFVFLALVFGGGFVIFGVGSDTGTGIGDLFRDGSVGEGSISVSDARERVQESPRNAEAKLVLANALQTEGATDEAIAVLDDYLALKPKDGDALRDLASLYLTEAAARQRFAQEAQLRYSYQTAGATFQPQLEVGEGQQIAPDPILEAIATEANAVVTAAYTDAQAAYSDATRTYERIVALTPRDPNVQLEFAQTAQQAGDVVKAIAAYERFVELAPDDPTAPLVKQQIAQLKGQQAATETG